jgi:hypothetical protein
MLKRTIILIVIAGSILLPSCVSNRRTSNSRQFTPRRNQSNNNTIKSGSRPDWVDNNSIKYNKQTYLTAIGFAKSRKQAEENARMEMSQIFNTKIEGIRESRKHAHAVRKDNKVKLSEMDFTSDTYIKNETNSIFAGLKLSEYWKDKDGTIYVLATMNKPAVLPPLTEKINKIDAVIEKMVEEANSSSNKMLKIAKLKASIEKSVLREYYNAQVAIISNGQTIKTKNDTDSLLYLLSVQLQNMNIVLSISGEGNKTVKSATIKALSDLGLKVKGENKVKDDGFEDFNDFGEDSSAKKSNISPDTDLVIEGTVAFKELDRGDNFKWVNGDITLTVKDNKTGDLINSIIVHKRLKRATLQDARRVVGVKIVTELMNKIKKELLNKMTTQK